MRFPSVRMVAAEARGSLVRWPGVLAAAFVAAVAGIVLVESNGDPDGPVRVLATATLALPLVFALTLTGERFTHRTGRLLPLVALPLLAGIFLAWPTWSDPVAGRRYVQLSLVFHLLAAWLPLRSARGANAFWQYNRRLFLRFLLGAVYTLVLFLGVSGALAALDQLFGLEVDGDLYAELFIVLAFVFHTWFFVGGIPRDLDALGHDTSYPTALKVLSQFILLPIVVLYLAILTAYLGKVAITQVWPSGWIGYLVTSVAAVGILSLLLVHPVRERAENRWVATYARWFYVALLPSIAMLVAAVWKRIDQYGVTENRYFLMVLSAWLAFIAVYFIASRAKSIQLIPLSLMVLAAVTAFGPLGAYAVSARSQLGRLETLLARNDLLDGRTVRAAGGASVPLEDRREISSVLEYLVETHGVESVTDRLAWPGEGTTAPPSDEPMTASAREARALLSRIDVAFVPRWDARAEGHFAFQPGDSARATSVEGFAHVIRLDRLPRDVRVGDRLFRIELDALPRRLRVVERAHDRVLVDIDLAPLAAEIRRRTESGAAVRWWQGPGVELEGESESAPEGTTAGRARLVVHGASGAIDEDGAVLIQTIDGILLLSALR